MLDENVWWKSLFAFESHVLAILEGEVDYVEAPILLQKIANYVV